MQPKYAHEYDHLLQRMAIEEQLVPHGKTVNRSGQIPLAEQMRFKEMHIK